MIRIFYFSLIILFSSAALPKLKNQTKLKPISVLILFFGDYKAEFQFGGNIQEKISGIQNETKDFKSDSNCQISARFQEVQYLNSRHLKAQFFVNCSSLKQNIVLSPEYIRLSDLKTQSTGIYFSIQHKNVQFKIKELKY